MDRLRRPRLEDTTEGSVGPDRGLHPTVVVSLKKTRLVSSSHNTFCCIHTGKTRAGYHSKNFDIDTDTDTLSSIPAPERYFFRYQFYEISFNRCLV